jgi:hypothetical protein
MLIRVIDCDKVADRPLLKPELLQTLVGSSMFLFSCYDFLQKWKAPGAFMATGADGDFLRFSALLSHYIIDNTMYLRGCQDISQVLRKKRNKVVHSK